MSLGDVHKWCHVFQHFRPLHLLAVSHAKRSVIFEQPFQVCFSELDNQKIPTRIINQVNARATFSSQVFVELPLYAFNISQLILNRR